jgi:BirA family biotin operon repressor/biotin-[acetyl-CoA-carboxylase] ligase
MGFDQQNFAIALQQVREFLSKKNFSLAASAQNLPLHWVDTLPSTNQALWELWERGASTSTVVIAAQQTAGRGQWGRQWQSERGGLYLSLGLNPNLEVSNSAQLTLCAAWGIAIALRSYDIPVLLKWPNDLLLLGRKLGGILTETRVNQGYITKAVVGVGINWCNRVPESGINLQSFCNENLSLLHKITSLEMLAAIVIQGLNSGYQQGLEQGIENLLTSYVELLDSKGRLINVDGTPGMITGVNSKGELKIYLNSAQTPTEICLKPGTISLGYPNISQT